MYDIRIATKNADYFTEAKYKSGNLAVHENWFDVQSEGWQITHIPTGLRVCCSMKLAAARKCAAELDRIADWDFTKKAQLKKKNNAATVKRMKQIMRKAGGTFKESKKRATPTTSMACVRSANSLLELKPG